MVREEQGTVRREIWQQMLDLSSVSGILLSVCAVSLLALFVQQGYLRRPMPWRPTSSA